MTSEEISDAIDRLKATPDDSLNNWNNWAVMNMLTPRQVLLRYVTEIREVVANGGR